MQEKNIVQMDEENFWDFISDRYPDCKATLTEAASAIHNDVIAEIVSYADENSPFCFACDVVTDDALYQSNLHIRRECGEEVMDKIFTVFSGLQEAYVVISLLNEGKQVDFPFTFKNNRSSVCSSDEWLEELAERGELAPGQKAIKLKSISRFLN